MARTDPTPSVHLYQERDDTPGVCRRCNCIKANAAHVEPGDPRLADAAEQQAQHHQRYERTEEGL